MFFCDFKGNKDARDEDRRKKSEKLLIFGLERNRTGAELKVLSSVETKNSGKVTSTLKEKISDRDIFTRDVFY